MLYQNDGFPVRIISIGLKDASWVPTPVLIVKDASYEVSEPTVDSQAVTPKALPGRISVFSHRCGDAEIRRPSDLEVL